MKKLILLPFIIFSLTVSATDYYISSSGNDANRGTSASSPWRTLNKLNAYFSSLQPGDNVFLKRGDVFYGSITINKSGKSGQPITIGAYGSGAKPVVSGFITITSWKNVGGNIWESTNAVSALPSTNMVAVNNVNTAMGRYPNSGFLIFQSRSGNSSITSKDLNGRNWEGAEIAMFTTTYRISRNIIKSQVSETLNYLTSKVLPIWQAPSSFFVQNFLIQNDQRTLDTLNEWYYNPSSKKLRIVSSGTPKNVQIATIETLSYTGRNNDYITYDNISFKGAGQNGIELGTSRNVTIQNCDFSFIGTNGVYGSSWGEDLPGLTISNCSFDQINNSAIEISKWFHHATISHNTIRNIGMLTGMVQGNSAMGMGISAVGASNNIEYNVIDRVAYAGINFRGSNTIVKNNLVTNFCVGDGIKDGGGIYTWNLEDANTSGVRVLNNIVLNGTIYSKGIDLDDGANGIEVSGNTVVNCERGIYLHNTHNIKVLDNTTYDHYEMGLLISRDNSNIPTRNIEVKGNIFFAKENRQFSAWFLRINPSGQNVDLDNNYYAKPISDEKLLLTYDGPIGSDKSQYYSYPTLPDWQKRSGNDGKSKTSPKKIKDLKDLRFEYNATSSSKTIRLDGSYVDAKNHSYNGSITLEPFTSAVLIRNGAIKNEPPKANAGSDQTIILPAPTVTLSGSATDEDGSIDSYKWEKLSGPSAGTINDAGSAETKVSGLAEGDYVFQVTVTDNAGATDAETTRIRVKAGQQNAPNANAGSDQLISLPASSISLNGSGSVDNGEIKSYNWTKLSGPSDGTVTNASSSSTTVKGLVEGVYQFRLQVTDENGNTASSTVKVTVNPSDGLLPAVDPGNTVNGLDYKYYEGDYKNIPDFSSLDPLKTGVCQDFEISLLKKEEGFSYNFTGFIDVPSDGEYTFYTNSDDGSNLIIDNMIIVDNGGLHGSKEASGTIALQAGKHAISVGYFQSGGFKGLAVSYEGPAISKQVIPASSLYRISGSDLLPALNVANAVNGLDYAYYENGIKEQVPDFTSLNPSRTGTSRDFDISPTDRAEVFSYNFTGFIDVPADGQYTFFTNSDDGSDLYIDNILVVDNDGLHGERERQGSVGLQAGKHAISVGYFQASGKKILTVNYAGPGLSKQLVPASSLYRVEENSLLPSVQVANTVNGLDYKYYEGGYNVVPDFASLSPVHTGNSNGFDISQWKNDEQFSYNFTGYINVPSDGEYTFYTNSDDGSNLFIDNILVVDNDKLHGERETSGSIGLKAGKHAISVGYFQATGSRVFNVRYAGPRISKRLIPVSALYRVSLQDNEILSRSRIGYFDAVNPEGNQASVSKEDSVSTALDMAKRLSSTVSVKAYPNPFASSVVVSISGDAGTYKLMLVDISGKVLWTKSGFKNAGTYQQSINTSALQRGMYFLQVIQNNKSSVIKLEK